MSDPFLLDEPMDALLSVSDVSSSTAYDRLHISDETGPLTLSSGDLVQFRLSRLPSDSGDTLNVNARVHGIEIFYNTTAATDN